MAITNFEEYTYELTDKEMEMLPNIVKHLKLKIGEANAITSKEVVKLYQDAKKAGKTKFTMTGARWRKIIHHIRINNLVPLLISTSKGYYIATKEEEIKNYILSLKERINSITTVYDAMEHQYKNATFLEADKRNVVMKKVS